MHRCSLLSGLVLSLSVGWSWAATVLVDSDAVMTGRVPASLSFKADVPEAAVVRALREFGPCVKIEFESACKWELAFPAVSVEPGKTYTFAISLASAAQAGKGYTPDIANFRPENQADKTAVSAQAGTAVIDLGGISSINVGPTGWKVLSLTFSVPADGKVSRIVPRMSGAGGGLFFIADATMAEGKEPPAVYLPEAKTLDYLQNIDRTQPQTLIQPGKTWGVYHPGETIVWKIVSPADPSFKTFAYRILNAQGTLLQKGEKSFPAEVSFGPGECGYYELVIRSTAEKSPGKVLHDLQGAAVISKLDGVEAGSTPFASCSSPMDLGHIAGLSWMRGGVVSDRSDISDVTPEAARTRVEEFKKYKIMPLEHTYNITYKSNAAPPGTNDDLPLDMVKFEQAFKQLASLGDRFSRHFEFWNEPEGRLGATPHWTIEQFTKSLMAAHKGIKAANPEAKVGIGSNLELVGGVHRCGGQDAYEFLILHPYPWAVGKKWNTPEDGMLLEVCLSARQWLDTHGGKDKEVWSTEFGYTTGATISGCSELQQSQMIVRASLLQLAGGLKYISQFRMDDVWFWGQVDGRFGFLRTSYTPKPSFAAYAALVRAVRGLPYRGRLEAGKNLAVLVFGDEKETALALWTNTAGNHVSLKVPAGTRQSDLFGKMTNLNEGTKELAIDGSVQYVFVPTGFVKFAAMQSQKFLAGLSGGIFDANLKRKHLEIPLLTALPMMDGKIEKWNDRPIRMDNPSQGFSAEIQAAVAGEFLFLSAKVRGDVAGSNGNLPQKIWDGDCIELYFTPEPDGRPLGFFRESDFHLGIAPGTDGSNGKVANILAGVEPGIPGAEARYVKVAQGGYDLEAKIPLSFFRMKSVQPGDRFGFDVQLGIGTREGTSRRWQETWSGSGQNYINPYLWGDASAGTKK